MYFLLHRHFFIWAVIILVAHSAAGCQPVQEGQALPAHAEIAFISWQDNRIQINKMNWSGSSNMTNSLNNESYPVWSPDGNQIAFLTNQNGKQYLALIDADGSNKRLPVETIQARDVPPSWAFDSQMVAFACTLEQRTTICLVSVTGDWINIMPGDWASLGSIQWAPADPNLLFHANSGSNRDIFVYTTYTNIIRNLTNKNGQNYSPTWSPDGRKIAFVSNRDQQTGIFTMNIDGTNPHLLLKTNIYNHLYWSPDSKKIAFSQASGENHLCIINTIDNFLCCTKKDGSHPTWSPDGHFLVYESRRNNKSYLYMTDNTCGQSQRLTNRTTGSFSPAWRP
jgi:Tol biopolymer transport system component